jgi:hypothetical protein
LMMRSSTGEAVCGEVWVRPLRRHSPIVLENDPQPGSRHPPPQKNIYLLFGVVTCGAFK